MTELQILKKIVSNFNGNCFDYGWFMPTILMISDVFVDYFPKYATDLKFVNIKMHQWRVQTQPAAAYKLGASIVLLTSPDHLNYNFLLRFCYNIYKN